MSLDDFFRKRIFQPLGMKDTYFYIPAEKQNRLVTTYRSDSSGKLQKLPDEINDNGIVNITFPKTNGTYYSGGAGLSSTIYDYAIFLQMLLNGGEYDGKRILSRHTINMMTKNQLGDIRFDDKNTFGLGFSIVTEEGSGREPASVGSYSWGGIYSTDYWVDPKEKIVGLIFKQFWHDPAPETNQIFKVMTYAALTD
jgi:CubicO group peptidase (beta-lactamase class C family)